MSEIIKKTYFAGGCFWGVEYHLYNIEGVISTKTGYMGGYIDNPTYEKVCGKNTGHAETVEIRFE